MRQVDHVVHLSFASVPALALALKVPVAQGVHVCSADTVATALVYVPAGHAALTVSHALPSFTAEYVEPGTQAVHWRSAVAEPAWDWPSPTGHVAHAVQLSVAIVELVLLLNMPSAHEAHVRSLLAVAATVVWKPGAHGALTAWQGAPLSTSEKVEPAVQVAHSRSAIFEPSLDCPCVTGHVCQVVQLMRPALRVKVPELQLSHVRSLLAVANAVVNVPATQALLTAMHVLVPPVAEKFTPTWHGEHVLSENMDPAT